MDNKLFKNPYFLIPLVVGIAFTVLTMLGVSLKFWWYLVFLVVYCLVLYLIKLPDALGSTALILGQITHKPAGYMDLFAKAYKLGCRVPAALQGYGWGLIAGFDYAKAVEVHETLLALPHDKIPPFVLKHSLVSYSIALLKCGRLDDAIAVLEQMRVDYEYFDADFYTTLGFYYIEAGQLEKAEEMTNLAFTDKKDYAPAIDNLGLIAYTRGDLETALPLFQKAVALRPSMVDGQYHLGLIAEAEGRFADALRYYRAALDCPLNGFKTVTREMIEEKMARVKQG